MIHVATITATVVGLVFLFFWAVDSAGDGHFGRFICYCRRTYPGGAFHHIHDNRADDAGNKRRNGRRSPHWHTSNVGTGYNSNTLVAGHSIPHLYGSCVLRPEYAYCLGDLYGGATDCPFSRTRRAEGSFQSIQLAAGGYSGKYDYSWPGNA